jgi:hypothetical protein
MRSLMAGFAALLFVLSPIYAATHSPDISSNDAALKWIDGYRAKPEPANVPAVTLTLSRLGAFNDPERCGAYVGFLAGVIGTNPEQAETMVARMLAIRSQDNWVIVRAIAYSGLPNWRQLLRHFADRLPTRRVMVEKYLSGKLPTLDQLAITPNPSAFDRFVAHIRIGKAKPKLALEPSPEALDTLWGYYFATGSYGPIKLIIAMTPWADDHDDAERLTVGSMAKLTLASNAMRDQRLLAMLRESSKAHNQPKQIVAALNEIADAAETVNITQIRKQALAAIEELKRKGPAYKRAVSWWGYVGESTLAAGCLAAAVTGQVALGLPCVIGGASVSAAVNFWNNQP